MDKEPVPLIYDNCTLCRESLEPGWLCSAHVGKPWGHGNCGAEASPCLCNPEGAVVWGKLIAEFVYKRTLN